MHNEFIEKQSFYCKTFGEEHWDPMMKQRSNWKKTYIGGYKIETVLILSQCLAGTARCTEQTIAFSILGRLCPS